MAADAAAGNKSNEYRVEIFKNYNFKLAKLKVKVKAKVRLARKRQPRSKKMVKWKLIFQVVKMSNLLNLSLI